MQMAATTTAAQKPHFLNPNAQEFHPLFITHTTTTAAAFSLPPPPQPPLVQLPHNHFHGNYPFYPSANYIAATTHTDHLFQYYLKSSPVDHHTPPAPPPDRPAAQPSGGRRFSGGSRSEGRCSSSSSSSYIGRRQGMIDNNNNNGGGDQGYFRNCNHLRGGCGGGGRLSRGGGGGGGERKKEVVVEEVKPNGWETTVMIRNIPNQYTRRMLAKFLDEFCESENKKLIINKDDVITDHSGEIHQADNHPPLAVDFLYLPIDFKREANKGYAFVNFTHPSAVWKLHLAANNKGWKYCSSSKICQIAYATIQGKKKLKEHFSSSKFVCNNEEYLPVCFSPPRDGSGVPVTQTTIGDRLSSSSSYPQK